MKQALKNHVAPLAGDLIQAVGAEATAPAWLKCLKGWYMDAVGRYDTEDNHDSDVVAYLSPRCLGTMKPAWDSPGLC